MAEGRGQEGAAEPPAAEPGQRRGQHAAGDDDMKIQAQSRLHPGDAAGDVLQDQCDAGDQTGDEAAARHVVAAQQQVDRHHQRQRQQRP